MSSFIENPPPIQQKGYLSKVMRLEMSQTFAEVTVKKSILQLIISCILNHLETHRIILQRDYKPIETPHLIFEWSMTHFKRRMQPDVTYIDGVLRKEKPNNLGLHKMLTDLQNLKWHLQCIAKGQVGEAKVSLIGCRKLLNIREELDRQYTENSELARNLEKILLTSEKYELRALQAQEDILHTTMDSCLDESRVSLPIYFRYERNYQQIHFDSLEHKLVQREEVLENSNMQYYETIKTNNYVLSSVLDHHNGKIQTFKAEIKYWTAKYEREFDKLSDEVSYHKIRIKALEVTWKDCLERIEFYHAEMRRIKEEDLQEAEIKAALLAAEEEERRKSELLRLKQEKRKKKMGKSQKK